MKPPTKNRRITIEKVAAYILLFFICACASSCDRKRPLPLRMPKQKGAPFQFVRAFGTDTARNGGLSGPAALVRLDDGDLLVLDRFNGRIRHYGPDHRFLGNWGTTPDGRPFPFTLLVDMTRDAGNGDIVVALADPGAVHNLQDDTGVFFQPDVILRFAPGGRYIGDPELIRNLPGSEATRADILKIFDNDFWNRNEQIPYTYYSRIAAYTDGGPHVFEVTHSAPRRVKAEGGFEEITLDSPKKRINKFCEIEAGADGALYLVPCLLRLEIYRAAIPDIEAGAEYLDLFLPAAKIRKFSATIDRRHTLYRRAADGSMAVYDVRGNRIFRWGPDGSRLDDAWLAAPVHYATDLEFDGAGGYYIADYVGDRVLHVGADGAVLGRMGTDRAAAGQFAGHSFSLFRDGPDKGAAGRPAGALGVAVGPDGAVYASDAHNRRIQKFDRRGRAAAVFPLCGDNKACYPADLLFSNNTLYVALYGARTVLALDPETGAERTRWRPAKPSATATCDVCGLGAAPGGRVLAVNGEHVFLLDKDLKPVPGWKPDALSIPPIRYPIDAAADDSGNIYVAGTGLESLIALSPADSNVCKFTPIPEPEICYPWGDMLFQPRGVAVAGGMLFVSSSARDSVIQAALADGAVLQVWGGSGRDPGMFQNPLGLAADGKGNLYVADNGNERIQRFRVDIHP